MIIKRQFEKECIPSFNKGLKDSDKRKVRFIKNQHQLLRVVNKVLKAWYLRVAVWFLYWPKVSNCTYDYSVQVSENVPLQSNKNCKWLALKIFSILYLISNFLNSPIVKVLFLMFFMPFFAWQPVEQDLSFQILLIVVSLKDNSHFIPTLDPPPAHSPIWDSQIHLIQIFFPFVVNQPVNFQISFLFSF